MDSNEQQLTQQKRNRGPKRGVVLLNMGGPDSLDSVKPFLYNLFSDPDIIRLPFSTILQKPLAALIVALRGEESKENYKHMGGFSPQLPRTQEQADALRKELSRRLGKDVPVYIAMRYWHPFTEEAVARIKQDEIEELIILSLYPHFSYTTTGSSLNALKQALSEANYPIANVVIEPYYNHPDYLDAFAETIQEGLDKHPWGCPKENVRILFSAHSLPVKHVQRTNDPYPEQIRASAETVMAKYFPSYEWDLSFQSRVGKMPWLGPYIDGVLHYYAGLNQDNILIVPISFVSDHVETLVELDRDYVNLAHDLGIQYCHRAPVMNDRPSFINTMANMVCHAMAESDHKYQEALQGLQTQSLPDYDSVKTVPLTLN